MRACKRWLVVKHAGTERTLRCLLPDFVHENSPAATRLKAQTKLYCHQHTCSCDVDVKRGEGDRTTHGSGDGAVQLESRAPQRDLEASS